MRKLSFPIRYRPPVPVAGGRFQPQFSSVSVTSKLVKTPGGRGPRRVVLKGMCSQSTQILKRFQGRRIYNAEL